jgi:hypothetical protein
MMDYRIALVHGSLAVLVQPNGDLNNRFVAALPFKHNAARRHRVGKMKFKVMNWPEYEAELRRRGSLTLWLTPEALSCWAAPRRKTRGGQPRYSDLAIETALTLCMVFGRCLPPPTAPMMESPPTTRSSATAPMLPSSFRRAQMRSNRLTIDLPARETIILRQLTTTGE